MILLSTFVPDLEGRNLSRSQSPLPFLLPLSESPATEGAEDTEDPNHQRSKGTLCYPSQKVFLRCTDEARLVQSINDLVGDRMQEVPLPLHACPDLGSLPFRDREQTPGACSHMDCPLTQPAAGISAVQDAWERSHPQGNFGSVSMVLSSVERIKLYTGLACHVPPGGRGVDASSRSVVSCLSPLMPVLGN